MRPLLSSIEAIKECSHLMTQCHLFIDNCPIQAEEGTKCHPPPPPYKVVLDCAKRFAVG